MPMAQHRQSKMRRGFRKSAFPNSPPSSSPTRSMPSLHPTFSRWRRLSECRAGRFANPGGLHQQHCGRHPADDVGVFLMALGGFNDAALNFLLGDSTTAGVAHHGGSGGAECSRGTAACDWLSGAGISPSRHRAPSTPRRETRLRTRSRDALP